MSTRGVRPDILSVETAENFKKWYWLKEELIEYAKHAGIPANGSKFEIRDRIIFALENPEKPIPKANSKKKSSKFNWAKESLSLETVITDSVSFGPNFRNFMKSQIGVRFNCHGDFMDWVKTNPGKTLEDAIIAWKEMEELKNRGVKRSIRPHNMMNQYFRDFFDAFPDRTIQDARKCWSVKSKIENTDGLVIFEESDSKLIKV